MVKEAFVRLRPPRFRVPALRVTALAVDPKVPAEERSRVPPLIVVVPE